MKLALRIMVALVVLLFIGMAGAGWWLHHYVQSPQFTEKIQHNISDSLNTQFRLGKLDFNIFKGFRVTGVEIENPAPDNASRLLKIDDVHILYSPFALFNKQLVIREFELKKPQFLIKFYPDGNSNLSLLKKHDDTPGFNFAASDRLHFAVILNQFKLQDGKLLVSNADQETTFLMEGVQLVGTYELEQTGARARGEIHVPHMMLGTKFKVTDASSTINFQNDKLSLPDLKGKAYNGILTGEIAANFGGAGNASASAFNLNLKLDKADALSLLHDFGGNFDWMQGKVNLVTQLEGNFQQPKLLSGKGDFEVTDTGLAKLQILTQIAQIFSLPELPETQFKQIKGSFKIGDQKITFYNIEAVADNVQISTSGSVTFDGVADFDVLLAISETLYSRIPEAVSKQLTKREDNFRTIIFHMSGPISEMKTNLPEKLGQSAINAAVEKLKDKLNLFKKPDVSPQPQQPAAPSTP